MVAVGFWWGLKIATDGLQQQPINCGFVANPFYNVLISAEATALYSV